ncbi:hypothetical protein KC340_g3670 [Hortaea werneckii]|nr:hypothetical protein KC339_g5738 [Hortaea werneckii]KAI7243803.1 hypothetical protein KC365_g1989 [Hortaea werneckii]KAI7331774.1 hypothetical protein KC340_g3670 [Hortaea werneckii]KAI7399433.1 hypothetical protein KC328_g4039 [Hortaea werneckii]
MDDIQEARRLINDIRRAKGVDDEGGASESVKDLEKALRILSEELYAKPTHFVLELIQNADDNRYDDAEPSLSVLYRDDGYLWVGCNEVGFMPENVWALCRIGDSTKKVDGGAKGFIGEKGIGFKSAFKVADRVWVKSGALSFMFDKDKRLGMIAPECADIPEQKLIQDRTVFCFRIPEAKHRRGVRSDIVQLKPALLLFLRKLRTIHVTVQDDNGDTTLACRLSRADDSVSGIRRTILQRDTTVNRPNKYGKNKPSTAKEGFLVFQSTVKNMPAETKRHGVSETELLMAFPVDGDMKPFLRNRETFNFLPIREYGLSFVLQGDFMLSASREDILMGNDWNSELVRAALELFCSAVTVFNERDLLKFTWLRYAKPRGNAAGTIFDGFLENLIRRLRDSHILLSQGNTLEAPSQLEIVPDYFADDGSPPKPLATASRGLDGYVSPDYDVDDLKQLQIQEMSPREFRDLIKLLTVSGSQQMKPMEWHSKVAQAFLHIGHPLAYDIALVPLSNGRWVPPSSGDLFLPEYSSTLSVPGGVDIAMITRSATLDPSRRLLFERLGATRLGSAQIFEQILKQHRAFKGVGGLSVEHAVDQAWFICTCPIRPRQYNLKDLLLCAHDGTLYKATELYMDDPDSPKKLSDFFGVDNPVVRRLHPQYFIQKSDEKKLLSWLQWLKNDMKVNTIPKLVGSDGKVTPEFTFIVNNSLSSAWLKLLRDYKNTYSLSDSVKKFFANVLVDCRGSRKLKLCDAYMPTPDVLKEASDEQVVDLIAIDDPENPLWSKLTPLGLRVKPDLPLFLKALIRLQSAPLTSETATRAKRIYGSLEGFARTGGESQKKIQSAFTDAHLIFVPLESGGGKWVGKTVCRWKSEPCLSKLYDVKAFYNDYVELFHRKLSIKAANASDIIDEMQHLDTTAEATSKAIQLLVALEKQMHVVDEINIATERLSKGVNIFPVQGKDGLISRRSLNDKSWFIADTPRLKRLFECKVDLLVEDDKLQACSNLMGRLKLDARKLSKCVCEKMVLQGEQKLNQELTDYVRVRAKYVALLANLDKRKSLECRFSTLDVISVDELRQRSFVQTPSGPVYGADEASRACVEYRQDSVQILVPSSSRKLSTLLLKDLCGHLMKEFGIDAKQELNMVFIFMTEDFDSIELLLEKAQLMAGALDSAMQPLTVVIDEEMAKEERRKVQTTKSAPIPIINRSRPSVSVTGGTIPALPLNRNHKTSAGHLGTEISGSSAAVRSRGGSSDTSSCAATSESGVGFGGSTNHIRFGEAEPVFVGRSSSRPKARGDVPERDLLQKDSSLDLSEMTKAFHVDLPGARDPSNGIRSTLSAAGHADEHQLKIGSHGEHMAYEILNKKFGVTHDQWTSSLREEHGFPAFPGFEGEHADFSVTDYQACQRISNYLIKEGVVTEEMLAGRKVTAYHIEVKATKGRCSEPFSLSDAQLGFARSYHNDRSEIYMVMRPFNLNAAKPSVDFFVDPYLMMLNGQLRFTAPGGLLLEKAG